MKGSNSLKIGLAAAMALMVSVATAAEKAPAIGPLVPIALKPGVNMIPGMASDGRAGMIVQGWRENGNAYAYDLYLVMLPSRPSGADWNVVGVEGDRGIQDTIRDAPHTGEDTLRVVRFARGLVDGQRETLLITATRDMGEVIPDPSPVTLEVFALKANSGDVGTTTDSFHRVLVRRTAGPYCNAEMAIQNELGLPVGSNYGGAKTPTGC